MPPQTCTNCNPTQSHGINKKNYRYISLQIKLVETINSSIVCIKQLKTNYKTNVIEYIQYSYRNDIIHLSITQCAIKIITKTICALMSFVIKSN